MRIAPLWIGLGITVLSCSHASPPPSAPHPMLGQAVAISLPTDTGELASVPAADARTTVLDFWAPTCVPCRSKVLELVNRRSELESKGARLVLVAVLADEESTELARDTLKSWGVQYPFLVDRNNASRTQLGVVELPATLISDAGGRLVWAAPSGATVDAIVSAVPPTR